MKMKMRILALVLVLSVALTGAGYAAWGSKITANTTLSSGDWEIVLENDVAESLSAADRVGYFKQSNDEEVAAKAELDEDKFDEVDSTKISGAKDVNSDNYVYTIEPEINAAFNEVEFEFYNLHPGTQAITRYEIRNKGSIPAKVGNIEVVCTDKDGNAIQSGTELKKLYKSIVVTGSISKHKGSGPSTVNKDIPANTTLANLETVLEGMIAQDDFQLDPKESANLNVLDSDEMEVNDLAFSIPIDALNGEEGEDSTLKVVVRYDFVQYNVLVEE